MEKARAHLYMSGRVQGVFYRSFTRDVAESLGLKGWAKNLFDGRVEAVFEGDKELIQHAIKECYKGPPFARVEDIEIEWETYEGKFQDFSIRYF